MAALLSLYGKKGATSILDLNAFCAFCLTHISLLDSLNYTISCLNSGYYPDFRSNTKTTIQSFVSCTLRSNQSKLKISLEQELIIQNIRKHISLSIEARNYFLSLLELKKFEKKELLLKEGSPCRSMYFVKQGMLRAYVINKNGKESTIMFGDEDWWFTDMYCFQNSLPAMVNIESLNQSIVYMLTKNQLEKLYVQFPEFNTYFRILMQNAYCREQLRSIQNLSFQAQDRYKNFKLKYPHILQKVPQKYIASYLGITPEFLSVLRAKNT